jgi:L-iditol 2-dehydrogenase
MQTLRLFGRGDLRIVEESPPEPDPDEELVRITAVGICGSDLHWFEEGNIGDDSLDRPLVLGHEFAGIIETGPDRGTRVAVDPAIDCGTCRHCIEGNPNLCRNMRFSGHGQQDGALREFITWPSRLLHRLPPELSDADGAMLEPLGVAIHSVGLAKVKPGDRVGIFGCGPIGLLIQQVAIAKGAEVVLATDLFEHRLEAAQAIGTRHAALAGSREAEQVISSLEAGDHVDIVFEAATTSDAVGDAIWTVRRGGTAILCGIPSDNRTSFDAAVARRKGLTLKLVRRMKHTYPEAIHLATAGEVDLVSLVTHEFSLGEFAEAFGVAVGRQGLKVMVCPGS